MKNKVKEIEPLKLIRWANHHYPPIDLSNELSSILELIEEVKRLRKIINDLNNKE